MATERLLTPHETASRLNISVRTLTRLRLDGKIGYVPLGTGTSYSAVGYTERDIQEFIDSQRRPAKRTGRPRKKAS
jgi:hypothetical protein